MQMSRATLISASLHVAVFVVAWFGVPQLFEPPEVVDTPLVVEVTTIADITNAPPQVAQPKPEPPKPEPPPPEPPKPEPPKPEPPKPEPPKPPPPQPPPPPPPPPPPTPPPPAPAPAPAPPPKAEAPTPLPPPPKARPQPPKPPQPAQQQPPQPRQRQQQFDFDAMLKNLARQRPQPSTAPQQQAQPQPPQQQAARPSSTAPYNPALPVSTTEKEFVAKQIRDNWLVDVGAKGIETFVVELRLTILPDGNVTRAVISNDFGRMGDGPYRSFAESALRAALKSSPLKLPPGRESQFSDTVFTFYGKDMIRG